MEQIEYFAVTLDTKKRSPHTARNFAFQQRYEPNFHHKCQHFIDL